MNEQLLKQFILETIRSLKKEKKFDFNLFKEFEEYGNLLTILRKLDNYAASRLEYLGSGSSRRVYLYSSKKVLKIAKDDRYGIPQNKSETLYYKEIPELFAKVYDASIDFKWILSELVNPVNSLNEVNEYFGINSNNDPSYTMFLINKSISNSELPEKKFILDKNKILNYVNLIKQVVDKTDISTGDFHGADQWGKTVDGRYVLLDYGATIDMYD